jgi:hypothetical protein
MERNGDSGETFLQNRRNMGVRNKPTNLYYSLTFYVELRLFPSRVGVTLGARMQRKYNTSILQFERLYLQN